MCLGPRDSSGLLVTLSLSGNGQRQVMFCTEVQAVNNVDWMCFWSHKTLELQDAQA